MPPLRSNGLDSLLQLRPQPTQQTLSRDAPNVDTAAQAGNRDRALELIADAEHAASRLPDLTAPGQPFSVTTAHVALYRVGVHWSLGDAGAALNVGRQLHPGQFPTPERRGRLLTDLARAWWQWGKPEQTVQSLLAAHSHAPAEVRDRPAIRNIVTDVARRHPNVSGQGN